VSRLVLAAVAFVAGALLTNGLTLLTDSFRAIGVLEAKLEAKDQELEKAERQVEGLRASLVEQEKRTKAALNQNELLARYGSDFELYRRWGASSDELEELPLGRCDGSPCFKARFLGLLTPEIDAAIPMLAFEAPGTENLPKIVVAFTSGETMKARGVRMDHAGVAISLLRGCSFILRTNGSAIRFEIEDDRHASVSMAVVVEPDAGGDSFKIENGGCRE
jgi:hypothetical protein